MTSVIVGLDRDRPAPGILRAMSGGQRVLVVDDDERLAASLRRGLEYAGYEVTVVHDGPRAIAVANRDRPAVVVLDVLLPGVDGQGVCRAIRAFPGLRRTTSWRTASGERHRHLRIKPSPIFRLPSAHASPILCFRLYGHLYVIRRCYRAKRR